MNDLDYEIILVQAAREFPTRDALEVVDIARTRFERANNRPYQGEDTFRYRQMLTAGEQVLDRLARK